MQVSRLDWSSSNQTRILTTRASKIDFTWAPPLFEQPIHAGRHVRIVCIGAGFSGLCAAIHLQKDLDNFDLQIYDKNEDVGGVCELSISVFCKYALRSSRARRDGSAKVGSGTGSFKVSSEWVI